MQPRRNTRPAKRPDAFPGEIAGVFSGGPEGGRIKPAGRKIKTEFTVAKAHVKGAQDGEVVRARTKPAKGPGGGAGGRTGGRTGARTGAHGAPTLPSAEIIECLGKLEGARAAGTLALADADIPVPFSPGVENEAASCGPAPLKDREDWRDVPLITIDGEDARDFDDAVFAEPDPDPKNLGGFRLITAIADVSWYVREGTALDRDARMRGNSVYLPDRAVPMLPESLSNGWCSLVPKEDRPAVAAEMFINAGGQLLRWRFARVMIRSAARLTYTQVHTAHKGEPDKTAAPLMGKVIAPLYEAYAALARARQARGALEIETPERRAVIGPKGEVKGVTLNRRFESHMMIEEFMILANVAAGSELARRNAGGLYRVHDHPKQEQVKDLRSVLEGMGMKLARGKITSARFNTVMSQAADTPAARIVPNMVLRSMAQAMYQPNNIGHFGLALPVYAHFTSPIRRYADLVVHRALVKTLDLGSGGGAENAGDLSELGRHLSFTERRASGAERSAMDRFTAMLLAEKTGAVFDAHINGASRAGVFVTLVETGADGLVPMSRLPHDFYAVDPTGHMLKGQRTGRIFSIGQAMEVRLVRAEPITGGLIFEAMGGPENTKDALGGSAAPGKERFKKFSDKGKGKQSKGKRKHKAKDKSRGAAGAKAKGAAGAKTAGKSKKARTKAKTGAAKGPAKKR